MGAMFHPTRPRQAHMCAFFAHGLFSALLKKRDNGLNTVKNIKLALLLNLSCARSGWLVLYFIFLFLESFFLTVYKKKSGR